MRYLACAEHYLSIQTHTRLACLLTLPIIKEPAGVEHCVAMRYLAGLLALPIIKEPAGGLEPPACGLQIRRTTSYATQAVAKGR